MAKLASCVHEARGYHQIELSDTVASAARYMADHGVGALCVGVYGQRVGLLTERDILKRVVAEGRSPATTLVCEVMQHVPLVAHAERSCAETLAEMQDKRCRHAVVFTMAPYEPAALVSRDLLMHRELEEQVNQNAWLDCYVDELSPGINYDPYV